MLSYIKTTADRAVFETTVAVVTLRVLAEYAADEARKTYGWIRYFLVRP